MALAIASSPISQLKMAPAATKLGPASRVFLRPSALPRVGFSLARAARSGPSVKAASASHEPSVNAAVATGIVLHGFPRSSTSFMTRYALNVKGVDYVQEPIEVVLLPNGKPDPEGEKPYLQAEGEQLEKPGAIFNFINEKIPGPALLPEDAAGRGRCRTLATLSATEVAPFGYYRAIRLLEDDLGVSPEGIAKWRTYWLSHGFAEIEAILQKSPVSGRFLHGDSVTMADIFVMPQVHYSQISSGVGAPFPLADYPLLEKCYKSCLEDEAFVKALPENCQ
mmetsp:Transcript_14178/g.40191  ORF Transcript_14178/g.40191 Transcript_14178/m.40191 type:complete len:280 (-) Transcript_14178:231-1070(-)|eukprot:CAMPEP_0117670192 /NCGR_PEP_ID=MMETSP0804-20121206/12598_1 /TAXON_ID=1074897 /ORGANISM="Tetraselmis astigmatica, Strain CCMP880" /LENGTH=279 /DNA_ID=CAMNT_0005478427 /DNA_START=245 /DNA_END=1084 /DNA_ORIENTATION=-